MSLYRQVDSDAISTFYLFLYLLHFICSDRHVVGQGNVNILHPYSEIADLALGVSFFLHLLIQFYLDNVANLHQLTSHSTTLCHTTRRSYRDHRLLQPIYMLNKENHVTVSNSSNLCVEIACFGHQ